MVNPKSIGSKLSYEKKVGNGAKTYFFMDTWVGDKPVRMLGGPTNVECLFSVNSLYQFLSSNSMSSLLGFTRGKLLWRL